jgi:hypothetical protein
MAIGLTCALYLGLFIGWFFFVKPAAKIEIMDVILARKANGGLPGGLVGKDVFDSREGDMVTVDARLTRPAYAFLISFRSDGKVEVCFPEMEDEPPPLTGNPHYPSTVTSDEKQYGLTYGGGLQAFAVVVSNRPLPAFKVWWSQCQDCPWKREDTPKGFVYQAGGIRAVDTVLVLSRDGPRDKQEIIPGRQQVAELAAWLLQSPGIDAVYVVGFTVEPKEKV